MRWPRSRRWKIAIWATVLFLVAGGTTAIIYRQGHTRRIYLGWKAEGLAASKAGDHRLAVYDLRSYLSVYFDDRQALRAYIHSRPLVNQPGDRLAAATDTIFALRHVITLEGASVDDQRRLMRLYQSIGQDTEAADAANVLLQNAPGDVEALSTRATALAKVNNWSAALAAAQKWSDAAPADIGAEMVVASAMYHEQTPLASIVERELLRRAGHADAASAFLVGFVLSLDRDDPTEPLAEGKNAAQWFHQAASESPTDPKVVMELARQLDFRGSWDEALALLRKADSAAVAAPVRRLLFRRLWEAGAWAEIVQRCKSGGDTSDSEIAGIDAVALANTGNRKEAGRIRELLAHRPDDRMAVVWVQVFDNPTDQKQVERLIAACSALLEEDGGDAPVHFVCGNANAALGRGWVAIGQWRNAANASLSWPAPLTRAAEMHLRRAEIDVALAAAKEAMRRASRGDVIADASVAIASARVVYAAKKAGRPVNLEGLRRLVDTVQKAAPGEPTTLEIQVALLAEAGQTDDAKAALLRLIDSPKLDERTLFRLAALSRSAHLGLEAKCYQRIEHDHGMTPTLAFEMAQGLLKSGDRDGGWKLLNDLHQRAGQADEAAWRLAICSWLEVAGDKEAISSWIRLGDEMPDDLAVQRVMLGSSASSDRAFQERTIARLRKLAGDADPQWRVARATLLLANPKCTADERNEVRKIAGDILQNDPSSAPAHWLRGGVLARENDTVDALTELRAAADLDPTSPRFVMELMPLLKTPDEFRELGRRLQCVADGPSPTPQVLMELGWLHEKGGGRDAAEGCYRRALALQPNLPPVQNNLAMLLVHTGRREALAEAIALARSAIGRQPGIAAYNDTLARACEAAGELSSAIDAMSHAIELAPDNLDFRIKKMEWLIKTGRSGEARALLETIDQRKPDLAHGNESLRFRLSVARQQLQ